MTAITDFKPLSHLASRAQLDEFIAWAKATLPKGVSNQLVHPGVQWDMDSWHNSGIRSCAFTAHGSPRSPNSKRKIYMHPFFMDFAKALVVHHRVFQRKKWAKDKLSAAKILEAALAEVTGSSDVTKVSAAICNRACEHLETEF